MEAQTVVASPAECLPRVASWCPTICTTAPSIADPGWPGGLRWLTSKSRLESIYESLGEMEVAGAIGGVAVTIPSKRLTPSRRLADGVQPLVTERALGAVAAALASRRGRLAGRRERVLAEVVRDEIRAGGDPLGEAFCRIRTPRERRNQGATYTPSAIVDHMLEWAARHKTPSRVVDPGAGSGRFILAAARRFPEATLVAVETDPLAVLILQANAEVLGVSGRLTIEEMDYRDPLLSHRRS